MSNTIVLFGAKPDWEPFIRAELDADRYECMFADLRTTDIDAFDLIVPLTLDDYLALEDQAEVAKGRALFPPRDVVKLCHDKLRFNQFVLASDLAWTIPPLLEKTSPPPFILKQRQDEFGANTHLVMTPDGSERLRAQLDDPNYFAQTYVAGDLEFATHILVQDGQATFHLNVAYEMGDKYYVKNKSFTQKDVSVNRDDKELDLFVSVLALIGFENGTCCFNYKYAGDRIQIFELNPRFGGSLKHGINEYLRAYEVAVAA